LLDEDSPEKIRERERRTDRHRVPYILIAPEDPLEIGRLAKDVYKRRYNSPLALMRSPSMSALGHLVNAASSSTHGELLSYLLFAEEFSERLIELGERDAKHWLKQRHDDGRWQIKRLS